MKVNVRMKNLPKKFDFKSNINTRFIYHAKEMEDYYIVTVGDSGTEWRFSKQKVHNRFVKKDYVLC